MNEFRTNKKNLIIGRTGSGKTTLLKKIIMALYTKGSFDKIVIYDEFDSDIWHTMGTYDRHDWASIKIPVIPIEKISSLKRGIVRVIADNDDIDYYFRELNKLRNALVVFEDASRSLEPEAKVPKEIMRMIYNTKQINVDFFLVFHSLMDVPKKLFRHINNLILLKTEEEKVPDKISYRKEVLTAFDELEASSNIYDYRKIVLNEG